MNPLGIGAIIDSVGKVASDLITTDKERIELELEGKRIDQATDLAQMEVNKTEAQNQNLFVAGWRPAIGWVGAAAMAYQFLLYPLLVWSWTWMQAEQIVPVDGQRIGDRRKVCRTDVNVAVLKRLTVKVGKNRERRLNG